MFPLTAGALQPAAASMRTPSEQTPLPRSSATPAQQHLPLVSELGFARLARAGLVPWLLELVCCLSRCSGAGQQQPSSSFDPSFPRTPPPCPASHDNSVECPVLRLAPDPFRAALLDPGARDQASSCACFCFAEPWRPLRILFSLYGGPTTAVHGRHS
eukprot:340449-Rhodomonas_salina.2